MFVRRRILIDTGEKGYPEYLTNLRTVLHKHNTAIQEIVLTHHHLDHIGGVQEICRDVIGGMFLFLVLTPNRPIFGMTQEWFRELSFSRLQCGVHDMLHIYTMCGIFYFPCHYDMCTG